MKGMEFVGVRLVPCGTFGRLQYLLIADDAASIFEIWFSEWHHDLGPISCEDAGNGNANLLIDRHDFPFG